MAKKDVVDEIGLPVEAEEVLEAGTVEQVDAETEKVSKKGAPKYPKIPIGEGVDPLTAGIKIPNIEPNNKA